MRIILTLSLAIALVASAAASELEIGIIGNDLPGQDPAQTEAVVNAMMPVSKSLWIIKPGDLLSERSLGGVDLLVLPSARSIPTSFIPAIDRYLKSGGRLIACGAPLGSLGVFKTGDKWMSDADYQTTLERLKPDDVLLTCDADGVKRLTRSSNDMSRPETIESVAAEDASPAVHVSMASLSSWDTLSIHFDHPFKGSERLTCFHAKGSENTRQLAVEWQESDGSRWIATVQLSKEWKNYRAGARRLRAWEPPKGRGGPGDALNPANARRFSVGLAFSHTDFTRGPQEYWFGNLGVAALPFNSSPDNLKLPYLDGLCPDYQFSPVHGAAHLKTAPGQAIVTESELEAPADLIALQPRPGGAGFDKHRKWRWQPLLEAYSEDGAYRGDVATLILPLRQEHPAAVAVFTPADTSFYQQPKVKQLLTDTARAIVRGGFLAEGGSQFFTQLKSDPVIVGARTVQLQPDEHFQIRMQLLDAGKKHHDTWAASSADATHTVDASQWTWPLALRTELLDPHTSQIVDRLDQELYAYDLPEHPNFIQAHDGQFFREGKPWKISGVNYMPRSGIGMNTDDTELFEQWMGAASYDPRIIQRDLERIKSMNLNEVSAFIDYSSLATGNLLDFLRRCAALDLKVNLAVRPARRWISNGTRFARSSRNSISPRATQSSHMTWRGSQPTKTPHINKRITAHAGTTGSSKSMDRSRTQNTNGTSKSPVKRVHRRCPRAHNGPPTAPGPNTFRTTAISVTTCSRRTTATPATWCARSIRITWSVSA